MQTGPFFMPKTILRTTHIVLYALCTDPATQDLLHTGANTMSIATLSARMQILTPQDEMIGSLTRERVALAVRYAGGQVIDGPETAYRWLAYALNTDIPFGAWNQLEEAFKTAHNLEDADLMYWYDVPNTLANREAMLRNAGIIIDTCVSHLSRLLCSQLGVK